MSRATRTTDSDWLDSLFNNPRYWTLANVPEGVPLDERVRLAEEGKFPLHRDYQHGANPLPWDKDYMAHPSVFRAAATYALHHSPTVRTVCDIFGSRNCPISMLISYRSFTTGLHGYIRDLAAQSVARNPRTPDRTLRGYLKGDPKTRGALASSPRATLDMLWTLAKDPDERVRSEVASHCRDADILDYLGNDSALKVRVEVTRNIHTGSRTLRRLIKDQKASVRAHAIANKRTPLRDVRRAARIETSPAAIAHALTRLGKSDQEVSARAANHESAHARKAAAATLTNSEILDRLAWDTNRGVRQIVSHNSNTGPAAKVALYLQASSA